MPVEKLPEKLKGLYLIYKESAKHYQDQGFLPEQIFWILFAQVCPSIIWDENACIEVKLSEVFRLYLSIYCEEINPQMTVEEDPQFLELLRERYHEVNRILFESHPYNIGLATLELGRFILGEGSDIVKQIQVGMDLTGIAATWASETPIPLKLVIDI